MISKNHFKTAPFAVVVFLNKRSSIEDEAKRFIRDYLSGQKHLQISNAAERTEEVGYNVCIDVGLEVDR